MRRLQSCLVEKVCFKVTVTLWDVIINSTEFYRFSRDSMFIITFLLSLVLFHYVFYILINYVIYFAFFIISCRSYVIFSVMLEFY